MLKRSLWTILLLPVALLVIALSVANRQPVTFSLDPFGSNDPALSVQAPLFIMLLLALIIGSIAGGIASWFNQGKWRKSARAKRSEAARWKMEAADLRRQADLAARRGLPAPANNRDAA